MKNNLSIEAFAKESKQISKQSMETVSGGVGKTATTGRRHTLSGYSAAAGCYVDERIVTFPDEGGIGKIALVWHD